MKLTHNAIETLQYILNFVDNPQNSDKKRLLGREENGIRTGILEQTKSFVAENKKSLNEYIKNYNFAVIEKRRELSLSKIKPELYEDKIREDEKVKEAFDALQAKKEEVCKSVLELELTELEMAFCRGLIIGWDKNIGWEAEEAEVSEELLEKF